MERTLQVVCEKAEIARRMDTLPDIEYEVRGGDMDYSVNFPYLSRTDSENVFELFSDIVYGNGEMSLAATLVEMLKECGLNISCAESCTGGMVSSSIVDIAGSSEVFYEGAVTYSNGAKMDRLGVSLETLTECGAVSAETAVEMANGLLNYVALGISTTGIAGPGGATPEKPVGLVYMACVSEKHTDVYRHVFTGDRGAIRRKAKNCVLFYAVQHIKNFY